MIRDMLFASAGTSFWTPANLFLNGEVGIWLDASDYSTLFQDSGGTTPVTSTSQPVGLWQDKSGTGNHVIQATSSKRPQTATIGTRQVIQFDGVDDSLNKSSAVISGTDGITVGFGGYIQGVTGGATFTFLEWSSIWKATLSSSTTLESNILIASPATATSLSYPSGISLLAYGKRDITNNTLEVNGNTYTGGNPSNIISNNTLNIPPVVTRGDVRISQLIVVNRQLSSTEKQYLLNYLNSKA